MKEIDIHICKCIISIIHRNRPEEKQIMERWVSCIIVGSTGSTQERFKWIDLVPEAKSCPLEKKDDRLAKRITFLLLFFVFVNDVIVLLCLFYFRRK